MLSSFFMVVTVSGEIDFVPSAKLNIDVDEFVPYLQEICFGMCKSHCSSVTEKVLEFRNPSGNLGRRREMAKQVSKQSISEMRAIVGLDPSEMDLIRALHLAGNDVAAAVNIYFDTPKSSSLKPKPPRRPALPPPPARAGGFSPQVRSTSSPSRPSRPSPSLSNAPKTSAGRPSNSASTMHVPTVTCGPNSASLKTHSTPDRPPPVNNRTQTDSEDTHSLLKYTPGNADTNGCGNLEVVSTSSFSPCSSEARVEAPQQSTPAVESIPHGGSAPTPVDDISVWILSLLYEWKRSKNVNRLCLMNSQHCCPISTK